MEKNDFSFIDSSVFIGKNVRINPFCVIKGNTFIGDNTIIDSYSIIENCKIGSDCFIQSSILSDSIIENNVSIGPFSKIIKNSVIGCGNVIGNFVEIKNSSVLSDTKIKHHAYIGDSKIGIGCNIGCGVIFANYDGRHKHNIIVGDNVFVGSNSVLIAPLNIEDNCYICAGTNLTKNLKENSFVIARNRETIKDNTAIKYLKNYKKQ